MRQIKVLYNDEGVDIFCTYSKERIECGEKYCLIVEQMYDGEIIELPYKMENIPEEPEENDEYIIGEE